MNRDLIILTYLVNENKRQQEQLPEWAKAEGLTSYDFNHMESVKVKKQKQYLNRLKCFLAGTLRGVANKLDPMEIAS